VMLLFLTLALARTSHETSKVHEEECTGTGCEPSTLGEKIKAIPSQIVDALEAVPGQLEALFKSVQDMNKDDWHTSLNKALQSTEELGQKAAAAAASFPHKSIEAVAKTLAKARDAAISAGEKLRKSGGEATAAAADRAHQALVAAERELEAAKKLPAKAAKAATKLKNAVHEDAEALGAL